MKIYSGYLPSALSSAAGWAWTSAFALPGVWQALEVEGPPPLVAAGGQYNDVAPFVSGSGQISAREAESIGLEPVGGDLPLAAFALDDLGFLCLNNLALATTGRRPWLVQMLSCWTFA